jgi:hypothetical protein
MSNWNRLGDDGNGDPDYVSVSDEEYFSEMLYGYLEEEVWTMLDDSLPDDMSEEHFEYIEQKKALYKHILSSLPLLKQKIEQEILGLIDSDDKRTNLIE